MMKDVPLTGLFDVSGDTGATHQFATAQGGKRIRQDVPTLRSRGDTAQASLDGLHRKRWNKVVNVKTRDHEHELLP